jgi:hypothetical protein
LPLADASLLGRAARRTTVVRRALALVLAAALAAGVVLLAHSGERAPAVDGSPKHTIVVLDLSGSIARAAYTRIGLLFKALAAHAADGRRVGLVLFSDVAQEALPPETKPTELLAYARYFLPNRPPPGPPRGAAAPSRAAYLVNPWSTSFSSGTKISSGLAVARRLVARDHLGSTRVLLASDLFDSDADARRLRTELLAYTRTPGLDLRVLPVPPHSPDTLRMFERYLGKRRVTLAPRTTQRVDAAGLGPSFPVAFVVLVGFLAVALGANEVVAARFRWQEPNR